MKPENGNIATEDSQSTGQTLRKCRESQRLSREDVASSLKLGLPYIVALENDQYDQLPGNTYTKGYIRSYCGLLKIDPDVFIDRLNLEPDTNIGIASKNNLNVPSQSAMPPRRRRRFRWFLWILLTVIVTGIAALYTTFHFLDQPSIPGWSDLNFTDQEEQATNDAGLVNDEPTPSQPARTEGLAIPVE
ncbi:MAG: helix-turn-helix domain-containing protein [Gammaproteobacteria bacterium]|nr:helix-turn-helix domain-containing protein [Gammaproteobacteria bacterium]MCY4227785.1 helix-turn-helix domain-containing protein [Gammaproteobacteria bacterium]MCY4312321.1 helix-turn-helix domain-containing protein [Gammaproteobacteria bacterium]